MLTEAARVSSSSRLSPGKKSSSPNSSHALDIIAEHVLLDGFKIVRAERFGPRTLDIDIIGYDEQISDDPVLTLPHPRAHERAFVLAPWHDLDPAGRLPGRGAVAALLAGLGRDGVRRQPGMTLDAP